VASAAAVAILSSRLGAAGQVSGVLRLGGRSTALDVEAPESTRAGDERADGFNAMAAEQISGVAYGRGGFRTCDLSRVKPLARRQQNRKITVLQGESRR